MIFTSMDPAPAGSGLRRLRAAMQEVMEQFDVHPLEIRGFVPPATAARPRAASHPRSVFHRH